ncbi:MAG: biotin synthase BioB [Gammaproteobacteria bacterium]
MHATLPTPATPRPSFRHDWAAAEVRTLFERPFNDLLFEAHTTHRRHFDPNEVQLSTLLNIKTGGCPEDCAYCPQSARFDTTVEPAPVLDVDTVMASARAARAAGATRFCMGAAWRAPKDRDLDQVIPLIEGVRELGMETCVTLGMLTAAQTARLADAGLDYYNHNLDTSPEFYGEIISTRTYEDRLQTLRHVREANINVCCGGIVGLGESIDDRSELLRTLANMPKHPESVPINLLVRVAGTPLADVAAVHPIDFVRTIAVARILMPESHVRLSAGRTGMTDELQALCYFAGANSIFYGEQLLTTANPEVMADRALFTRLGLSASVSSAG